MLSSPSRLSLRRSSTPNAMEDLRSQSFANLAKGSLTGVFGSEVSLAELAGDDTAANDNSVNVNRAVSKTKPRPKRASVATAASSAAAAAANVGGASDVVPFTVSGVVLRIVILFAAGVVYGRFSRHLHDNHSVSMYTLDIDQTGTMSLLWGSQGIVQGFLLPLLDTMLPDTRKLDQGKGGSDWISVVRAAGAFMGVAYGIGKFSWSSTMQATFYFGMVNPCLWYILDATRNGFILSTLTAVVGTGVFAVAFPSHLPPAGWSEDYVSVTSWVASVLFCCSICFGNLGRRLLTFS